MNYFFELLDSYHKRGCCISSRIDETGEGNEPDYYGDVAKLYDIFTSQPPPAQSPGGNTISVSPDAKRSDKGGIVVNVGGTKIGMLNNGSVYRVRDGAPIALTIMKEFHTKYFGKGAGGDAGEGAGEGAGAGETQNQGQQQQKILTPYDRERMEKAKQIQKTRDELNEKIIALAKATIESATPLQLCKLRVGQAINSIVKARDKGAYANNALKQEFVDFAYEAFKSGKYCEAFTALSEGLQEGDKFYSSPFVSLVLDTDEKLFNALTASYENSVIRQLAEISNLDTAKIKNFFYNEDCPRNVKRSDCVSLTDAAEIVGNAQLEAGLNNFNEFLEAITTGKGLDDPLKVANLRNLVRFTRQGDMIIQGTSLGEGIAVRDRGRLMHDFLSLAFKKATGKDLIVYDLETTSNGGDISIRGLVFEHMFPLLGLFKGRLKAKLEGNKDLVAKFTKAIDQYVGSIDKMCRFLQSFRDFVQGYENHQYAVKEKDLQSFDTFREELDNLKDCQGLSPVLMAAMGRAEQRFSAMDPDFALQVGKEVTDGTREDILYCYDNLAKAKAAAAKSNLDPNSVEVMRVKDLLELAPEFAKSVPSELLGDPTRKIAIVREGLKLSTSGKTRLGSSSIKKTVGLFSTKSLNDNQRNHRDKSRKALGLNDKTQKAIEKHQRKFSQEYEKTEAQINNLKKESIVTTKDGKVVRETGITALDSLIKSRRASLSAKEAINDEVLSAADNLTKLFKNSKATPEQIQEGRDQLTKAFRSAQVKKFITDGLAKKPDGSFVDPEKAAAAADFLVRSGSTNTDMSTTVIHLKAKGGYSQTINHNNAVAGLLREALAGDSSVSLEMPDPRTDDISAGGKFTIKAKKTLPNGKTVIVNYDFEDGNMITVVNQAALDYFQTASSKNESSIIPKLEKMFSFILERLSGMSSKPVNIFSDTK